MAMAPIVALEIGTARTVVLVGEPGNGPNGEIEVTGMGARRSVGVCKGLITEVNQARLCVEEAVRDAAEESDTRIGLVHLAVSGGHIASEVMAGHAVVESADSTVEREDMDAALQIIDAASVGNDRQILHRIPQFYTLDGKEGILHPEGMHGRQLAANALVVHGRRNHLDDALAVARAANLDVRDTVFAGLCAAKAVLTAEQKRDGVLLLHLGGGVTDCVCFVNGAPVLAASLPVGGDHATNDIKYAFNITTAQAEDAKCGHGCAVLDPAAPRGRIVIPQGQGFGERAIPPRALHTVMNARYAELLGIVRQIVDEQGCLPHLAAGVVLTGGGAYVPQLPALAGRVFGCHCAVGEIRGVTGLENDPEPARLAAAAGLLLHGFEILPTADTPLDRLGRKLRKMFPWTQQ